MRVKLHPLKRSTLIARCRLCKSCPPTASHTTSNWISEESQRPLWRLRPSWMKSYPASPPFPLHPISVRIYIHVAHLAYIGNERISPNPSNGKRADVFPSCGVLVSTNAKSNKNWRRLLNYISPLRTKNLLLLLIFI